MAALCPSGEAMTTGAAEVIPRARGWPPVGVVRPGPGGRAPRLVSALKGVNRGFLFQPLPGYGVARVCRACGEPAACAACGGMLRSQGGAVRCTVCGADGTCASCGAADFGIARGGAERVEEWARAVFRVTGDAALANELASLEPRTLLSSGGEGQTVCLVALDPGAVRTFGRTMRALSERGVVTRVEAEPHL